MKTEAPARSLAFGTALNLLGQILPVSIGLFAIPVLIHALGKERFGILSLIWVVIGYFALFDLGLGRAVIKLVAEKTAENNEDAIPPIFWTVTTVMAGCSAFGALILGLITPWIVKSVFEIPIQFHDESIISFRILASCLVLVTLTSGLRGVLEGRLRFAAANVLQVLTGATTYLGPLIALLFSAGLVGVTVALALARAFSFFAHALILFKEFPSLRRPQFLVRSEAKGIFGFAGWITVSNVLSPLMVYFDRFILGAIVPVAQVIYYTTPFEMVSRLQIVPTAVVRTLFPVFSGISSRDIPRLGRLFKQSVRILFVVLFPSVLVIFFFAEEGLKLWLGPDFAHSAAIILQLLALGILLNSIAWLPYTLLQGAGRSDLTAKLHIVELPFFLCLVWLAISKWGVVGAAYAFVARSGLDMVFLFVISKRLPSVGEACSLSMSEAIRLMAPLGLLLLAFIDLASLGKVGVFLGSGFLYLAYTWLAILTREDRDRLLGMVSVRRRR